MIQILIKILCLKQSRNSIYFFPVWSHTPHPANIWKTKVTILEDGIRSNGEAAHAGTGDIILAVGDSFTFGDEVSDDETWPAKLEKISGKRVINGGVFGYGVDQIYLRMRTLARRYKPDIIIFSLDDIQKIFWKLQRQMKIR